LVQQESKTNTIIPRWLRSEKKEKWRYSWKVSTEVGRAISHHKNKQIGAFHLANMNGEEIDHNRNIEALRRCYP
jgi:hypothetical protein